MELEGKTAQVSLDTFMSEFVPGPDMPTDRPIASLDYNAVMRESGVYKQLCKAANSVLRLAVEEGNAQLFEAKNTHLRSDREDKYDRGSSRCPGIIFYPGTDAAKRAYTIEAKALPTKSGPGDGQADGEQGGKESGKRNRRITEARTSWPWAALLIEAKSNADDSPFVIPKDKRKTPVHPSPPPRAETAPPGDVVPDTLCSSDIVSNTSATGSSSSDPAQESSAAEAGNDTTLPFLRKNTDRGAHTLRQTAEYVSMVLQKQFILFFFTIFVCREYAWLLRWDRAGLVVSGRFNFIKHPHLLHRFIYRFACLDDVQRGRDPTVSPATAQEIDLIRSFDQSTLDTDWQREAFHIAFASGHPIYRIDVPQDDTISPGDLKAGMKTPQSKWSLPNNELRHFLVGKPYFTGSSVVGRGTRGHIAYDVSGNRLVFCKEYWRLDVPSHHPEGEVLMHLHSKGVQYIATPIVAGDVRYDGRAHCTRSQASCSRSGARYIQYRMIVLEIGEPLKNYQTSQQLVGTLCHALIAHEGAWTHGMVLHRDISVHNILIFWYRDSQGVLRSKGLLIDWGLCKYMKDLVKPPSQLSRSGTWQFISAVLLASSGRFRHAVWHDLESFIHVLHWMCFRFQLTDFSSDPVDLHREVQGIYDSYNFNEDGESVGGKAKLRVLREGRVPFQLQGGSAAATGTAIRGIHPLLVALAALYKEHYKWFEPKLLEAMQCGTDDKPDEAPFQENADYEQPDDDEDDDEAQQVTLPVLAASEGPGYASPALTHQRVLGVFRANLRRKRSPWVDDAKQTDQFVSIKNYLWQQDTEWVRSSKRRLDDDSLDSSKSAKRPRRNDLGSIAERADSEGED